MTLSYEAVAKLFRQGDFVAVVSASGRNHRERAALEPRQRAIVGNSLALIGELSAAEQLAELDRNPPTPAGVRSQTESTYCVIHRRRGNHFAAIQHAQSAVVLAQESSDLHRIAWAHLHLFRLLVEIGPLDKALASLADARRATARAGDKEAVAYLHTCVAVLEGQIGRLDEAGRHCSIAEGLVDPSSNLWLAASCLINRGCIAWLTCRFDEAREALRQGRILATRIGHAYLTQAADTSAAYVHLLTGDLTRAENGFLSVARQTTTNVSSFLACRDGLARVYLASSRLDDAEQVISEIIECACQNERAAVVYHVRWAAITEARLLASRKNFRDALNVLDAAEERFRAINDNSFLAAVELTRAQILAVTGETDKASRSMLRVNELNITEIRDLQAAYYYGCSLVVEEHVALSTQVRERAIRLWASQGIESVRLEMDGAFPRREPVAAADKTTRRNFVECITDSLASLCDLAHRPRVLAEEIASVLRALECASHVELVEVASAEQSTRSTTTAVLTLQTDKREPLSLVCQIPDDPVKATLLADVFRIARAALELERARKADGRRAAIWPASTPEEHAGALFVAEEMQALLASARRIATTNVSVLITGETGTGKEILARTIHAYSARAGATFLPFNCTSVPRDMLDSQLFGHRKGSFTGATDNFPGVIRAAAGGTLFLDEIGEATLDVQPKLLRFLDSTEVHPIGDLQPVKADVRVIAATNVDLEAFVAQGRFREDLFYRLNIVRLHIPPLRERRGEIPVLANHYVEKYAQEYRKGDLRLAEETMDYLLLYRWPGNVRQLANEMRRMAALTEPSAVLMPEHLSAEVAASRRTMPVSDRLLDPTELVVRIDQPIPAAVRHLEQAMIQHALRACGGRMENAAAMLGLSRKGLYLKRMRYGLEPPHRTASAVA